MGREYKAVIFDNDNTIAKIYPDPRRYWLDVFVKTVEECGGHIPEGKEEEYMLSYYTRKGFTEKLQTIGLKTSWDDFQKAKGVVDERSRIGYIREGKSRFFPDAVDFMRFLHARGVKYGVATFTTRSVVLEAFHQIPDLPVPEAIFDWNDSLRENLEKPNPGIARTVLEKLGVKAEQAIMAGDRLTDIEMGNMAGMTTVLVKRVEEDGDLVGRMEEEIEKARSEPGSQVKVPALQVTTLTEIKKLFQQ
jgi:HAD superfamily hydrolase (TIGR01509 family)